MKEETKNYKRYQNADGWGLKREEERPTLPEFWSGALKLKMDFNPGAASSTVAVIKT